MSCMNLVRSLPICWKRPGASTQFLDNPLQRAKRDVDVIAGHVVFDYDVSRELAGALELGATVSPFAML
jgi:3-hydroxy-9,10-secoandrosta-1,3,5(10)-triene-9,17-dione monooxygenase